jgi:xanthine dehydrogenase YagS FAD-binding subunit
MKDFDWAEPQDLEQAMALLAKGGARAAMMAGGTDLITEIKEGVAQPDLVIDLRSIPGLSFINMEKDGVHIGAMTTVAELAAHSSIRQEYPGLYQAAMSIGTPQLRNVGTVGGNLCQRPRCWYYRDAQIVCRKKGGSQCYAFRGRNKYHAILGGGMCYIVYPSDLAPALISMGAQAVIASPRRERKIPLEDFYALPSQNVRRENVLAQDELLREIHLPPAGKEEKSAYIKLKERGTWDFALVSAAAAGAVSGKRLGEVRIVLGGVAPVPWRLTKAEGAVKGKTPSPSLIKEAARLALQDARPLQENGYKRQLVEAALGQVLAALV